MHSFFRKLAQGVGPSLGLVLAVAVGYDAALGAAQPMEVATNLKTLVIVMNTLTQVGQLIAIALVYNLDKKTLATMQEELEERRAAAK